jgi:hypothetical protein
VSILASTVVNSDAVVDKHLDAEETCRDVR